MVATILEKIDRCSVFVADVTLTHKPTTGADKLASNPNVAFELGYAMRRLTHSRVLLVQNVAYGGPERLPFDLRGHRAVTFTAPPNQAVTDDTTASLAAALAEELRLILSLAGPPEDVRPPLNLTLKYREDRIEGHRHDYRLIVSLENRSSSVINDWAIEVQMPRALLDPRHSFPEAQGRSNHKRVVMRLTEREHSGPIYPGDNKEVFGSDYHMDDALYDKRSVLFPDTIEAAFFVAGKRVATASKLVREMQKF